MIRRKGMGLFPNENKLRFFADFFNIFLLDLDFLGGIEQSRYFFENVAVVELV